VADLPAESEDRQASSSSEEPADGVLCPKCGAPMRVIALIQDPTVIERILSWLGLWEPLGVSAPPPPAERASLPLTYHPVPDIA